LLVAHDGSGRCFQLGIDGCVVSSNDHIIGIKCLIARCIRL
jgi:hypothetical protein